MTTDVIFYSFHTPDDYYTGKAAELKDRLRKIGLPYQIDEIEIPEGQAWPDICRKKIGLIYDFCVKNSGKKVFWIDVDCYVDSLPEYVAKFSSDVIGFQRGFSSPMKIGYHRKTRFWEPCLLGINSTEGGRRFIEDAFIYEQNFEGQATDDYFFEESWRFNCANLSFQVIPSSEASVGGRNKSAAPFFYFGASGNVEKFKGKVEQHLKTGAPQAVSVSRLEGNVGFVKRKVLSIMPLKLKKLLKRVLVGSDGSVSISGIKDTVKKIPLAAFRRWAVHAGAKGDVASLQRIVDSAGGEENLNEARKNALHLARSLAAYMNGEAVNGELSEDTLLLSWWINPAPGNFGDWLSPYIFQKVSGKKIQYANPQNLNSKDSHYVSVGSIGKFAAPTSIVLGTGVSASDAELEPSAKYLSVRGPLTRNLVLAAGGECPEIYGDPAIILPRLFMPEKVIKKKGKIGLIRHFKHRDLPLLLPENVEAIDILASSPADIEGFITRLHSYDFILSSAMHGYIVCQAYGIPCGLINFRGAENAVHGDGMKYDDYFLGLGMTPRAPQVISRNLRGVDLSAYVDFEPIPTELMDSMYSYFKEQLG